ncbi:MAG: hypothetical protein JNJ67_02030, partial [Chromatiales bacterium]|nr:hypothetical protein [Chromatiales bacterium]
MPIDAENRLLKEKQMSRSLMLVISAVSATLILVACQQKVEQSPATASESQHKIGILLVNHGSRQKAWRDMLMDVEKAVDDRLLALPNVKAV